MFFCFCLLMAVTPDRKPAGKRTPSDSKVHLLHADRLYFDDRLHTTAQILVGDVRFDHEGVLLYCDSALFYEATNSFDAFGNVRMNQGDTLTLNSEVLFYNGLDRLARARYAVVFKHGTMTIFTDSLDYDRLYDLGYFFEGGRVRDHDNELTSDWGEYSPATHEAVFNYNVRLVNPAPPAKPETILISDTLHYNTETAIAHIVGPSNIENGENHIYSELGYYDTQAKHTHLLDRSILSNNGKRLVGDSVVWNDDIATAEAFGNVVYNDVVNKNMFTGGYCYYEDITGYVMATDSAVVIDYSQQDTMYAHADTFKVFTYNINTDSVYRVMHAYNKVRAYRLDIQAVCDSLVYNSKDSCMTMYTDPILWNVNQQLLGEMVQVFMKDSVVDHAHVINQAFSIEKLPEEGLFNQVSSNDMYAFFKNGEMHEGQAVDHVLVAYYPVNESDSTYEGLVRMETSKMRLLMEHKKLVSIWTPKADGMMYPMTQIPPDKKFLEGFYWFDYVRPLSKDDIFDWRPKKPGTEIKTSKRSRGVARQINTKKDE